MHDIVRPTSHFRDVLRQHRVAEQFLEQGYATFPSGLPQYFETMAKGVARLLQDPLEMGRWIVDDPLERDTICDARDTDIGILVKSLDKIEPRHKAEGRLTNDRKQSIHFNPRLVPYLEEQRADLETYSPMLYGFNIVHNTCEVLSLAFAEELDTTLPGFNFLERLRAGWFWNKTRLVSYHDHGKFHRDRNGFTFAIQSNAPGLWLQDRSGRFIRGNETDKASIMVFSSKKFWMITERQFPATLHGVVEEPGRFRQSLVFFTHLGVSKAEWDSNEEIYLNDPRYRVNQEEILSHIAELERQQLAA